MNGGELVVKTLLGRGVDTVFFVAGGTFITVMEAMSHVRDEMRAVPMRLESSATFGAESYAALARKPAAVFVTRAPGAANACIGVHNAMQSSRPMVLFIAGIPGPMKGREAFQEIDYALMYRPIAKAVLEVHSFDELAAVTARAVDLSVTGRPGPVVVSVGRDVLDGPSGEPSIPARGAAVVSGPQAAAVSDVAKAIAAAKRPIILAGEMIVWEGAHASLARLADATGAGVLVAYRQQDVMDNGHAAYLGHLTLNRLAHVEQALDDCDLLVSIGSRLDSVTTHDYTFERDGQDMVMIHPDPAVFSQWQPAIAMASDAGSAMDAITSELGDSAPSAERLTWRDELHTQEAAFANIDGVEVVGDVNLAAVLAHFRTNIPADSVVVSDAGTFGRWLHRFYPFTKPDTCLGPVSGAMGYGVPGGIGACLASNGRPVFTFVGDGGFLMTGQEAATIAQEQLPLKIVVCDNAAWGSILVSAEKRFPGMDFGLRLRSPDFGVLGDGYGLATFAVTRTEEFPAALAGAMATDGPALIHLRLDARDVSPYKS
jgi:acetolactate synthase I/II/III large subunit